MEKELNIQVRKGGPYIVSGDFKLILPDGEEKVMSGKSLFCRCGQSKRKPFCDGVHRNVEFDI